MAPQEYSRDQVRAALLRLKETDVAGEEAQAFLRAEHAKADNAAKKKK